MDLFPNKYEKEGKIIINGKETTLIDHLKLLRTEKNLNKAQISRIIKNNDYWYSQIEMSDKSRNKGDDNRRKYIKRSELLNIISVVCFNAKNSDDLITTKQLSENYVDNLLQIKPLTYTSYQKNFSFYNRTKNTQENIITNLSKSIELQLTNYYNVLIDMNATNATIDRYIELLNNFNETLKADKFFAISLAGLPVAKYLYESTRNEKESLYDEISEIINTLEDKEKIDDNDIKNVKNELNYLIKKYDFKRQLNKNTLYY